MERALDGEAEPRLAIGGGVAANRLLRERAASLGVPVHIPPPELCTDNAAMIGSAARLRPRRAVPGLPRARRLRDRPPSRSIAARAATCATTRGRPSSAYGARQRFPSARWTSPSDDDLHRRYLERIPVVTLGDEELFEYFVDETALEAKLYRLPG